MGLLGRRQKTENLAMQERKREREREEFERRLARVEARTRALQAGLRRVGVEIEDDEDSP